jgi:tRNA threonylcarbamoyladenosine biosynthesis protein TsaE
MKHKNLNLAGVKKLAANLYKNSGPKNRIFGLVGPLGSGKTTFVKALAKAFGENYAKSPTFTIVHCYKAKGRSLYHIDLYRLNKVKELDAIGLDEMIDEPDSVAAIEWADKFPSVMKRCHKIISFEVLKGNLRNVTVKNN